MNIIIKPISLDDVLANDKTRYNTNNHWENDKNQKIMMIVSRIRIQINGLINLKNIKKL